MTPEAIPVSSSFTWASVKKFSGAETKPIATPASSAAGIHSQPLIAGAKAASRA